jgi:hypothetical protein
MGQSSCLGLRWDMGMRKTADRADQAGVSAPRGAGFVSFYWRWSATRPFAGSGVNKNIEAWASGRTEGSPTKKSAETRGVVSAQGLYVWG